MEASDRDRRGLEPEEPQGPSPSQRRAARAGTITRVERQQRNRERVSIFIDDEFAFGLPAEEAVRQNLKPGRELDDADAEALAELDEGSRATEAAVQFIAYRPRSENEVRDRLRRRGYGDEAIEQAIERVSYWGYLDDSQFAAQWIENRLRHRPRGSRLLRQELIQHGVDRDTADLAVDEAEIDEHQGALELARKRARQLGNLDTATRQRRLTDYLARRGFDWDVVRDVVREVLHGDGE